MIIVAKVGSSSVTDAQGEISHVAVDKFCGEVAGLRSQGHRVVIVGRSPNAAKQLASRARNKVQGTGPLPDADPTRQRLPRRFTRW